MTSQGRQEEEESRIGEGEEGEDFQFRLLRVGPRSQDPSLSSLSCVPLMLLVAQDMALANKRRQHTHTVLYTYTRACLTAAKDLQRQQRVSDRPRARIANSSPLWFWRPLKTARATARQQ